MAPTQAAKEDIYRPIKVIQEVLGKYGISFPPWFQVLIWAIAIVVLIAATVNDTVPLVNDYQNDTTNVAVKSRLVTNEPFAPPTLILQIPQFKVIKEDANAVSRISGYLSSDTEDECVECQRMANVSWDVWRDMNISMMKASKIDITKEITLALIRKIIQSIESGIDVLDDQYSHWNQPLIDACFYFISWQTDIDRHFGDPEVGNELSLLNAYNSDRKWNGTRLLDYLGNRVLKAVCNTLNVSVVWVESVWLKGHGRKTYTCLELITQASVPVLMDLYGFSLPIPCSGTQRVDIRFDFMNSTTDDRLSMWTPAENRRYNQIVIYTATSAQYHSEFDSTPFWLSTLGKEKVGLGWPEMMIGYSVTMRAVEHRDNIKDVCYNETSAGVCLNKCSKQWIMKHCGCIPFSFRKGINWPDPSLPYCTHKHYNDCDPMAYKNVKDEYCEKLCMYPCEYYSFDYSFHTVRNEDAAGENDLGFSITTKPQIIPFVEFAWITKDSPQAIASQIGGIFGLYLGLSGLSVFIFIITCLDFTRRFYHHQRHPEIIGDFRAISLWQTLLLSKSTSQPKVRNGSQPAKSEGNAGPSPTQCMCRKMDDKIEKLKTQLAEMDHKLQQHRKENHEQFEKYKNLVRTDM